MKKSNITVWGIRIKQAESLDMDAQLHPIFDFIEQNIEHLKLLSKCFESEWRIDVYITIRNECSPSMVLSSKQMALANAINATINFDVYAHQR
jgi:hypothetical protein